MRDPPARFHDDGRGAHRYLSDIMVRCPRCRRLARVTETGPKRPYLFTARRLTCTACAHRAEWHENEMRLGAYGNGEALDPYFLLPLALQTPTRHGVLFAYNGEHLAWIEGYVAAGLRERHREGGWSNQGIASRLPRWVKSASNRDEVIRAIARLRRGLGELTQVAGAAQ